MLAHGERDAYFYATHRMRGAVTVQSQADFQSFLAEEAARLSGN